jgi:hypothetical protein
VCLTWSPHKDLAWFASGDVGLTVLSAPHGGGRWSVADPEDVDAADVPDVVRDAQLEVFGSG